MFQRQKKENASTTLKPNAWQKLNTAFAKLLANKSDSEKPKVHCRIPICAGHNGAINAVELETLVKDIIKKGYDYTIYVEPRDRLPSDAKDAYEVWKEENAKLLADIPKEKVVNINTYRQSEEWQNASKKYAAFRQLKEKMETVNKILETEVETWIGKHKLVDSPNARVAVTEHMLNTVTDCISWMEELTSNNCDNKNKSAKQISVLFYGHALPQIVRNALLNAKTIGYLEDSLIHLYPSFDYSLREKQSEQIKETEQPGKELPFLNGVLLNENDAFFLQAITAGLSSGKMDPLDVSKVLFFTYQQILSARVATQEEQSRLTFDTSSRHPSPPSLARNKSSIFQPVPMPTPSPSSPSFLSDAEKTKEEFANLPTYVQRPGQRVYS